MDPAKPTAPPSRRRRRIAVALAAALLAALVAPSLLAASAERLAETDDPLDEAQAQTAGDGGDALAPEPAGIEDGAEPAPPVAEATPAPELQGAGEAIASDGEEGDRSASEPAKKPRASRKRRGTRAALSAASGAVDIRGFAYSPREITVRAGEAVSWTNRDREPHDAEAFDGSFKTRALERGESDSVTFANAGTFRYFCSIHPPSQFPDFTGTVRVVGPGGAGETSAAGGDAGGAAVAGGEAQAGEQAGTGEAASAARGSDLPATGLGLVPLSGLGLALFATGALLRRFRLTG
jgi:plastocyanin